MTVDLDDEPRVVTLSGDVEAAYKRAGLLERYRQLSYSHQREYAPRSPLGGVKR